MIKRRSLYRTMDHNMIILDFMSIQKEQVVGFINALPIVASWNDAGIVFVAIGNHNNNGPIAITTMEKK